MYSRSRLGQQLFSVLCQKCLVYIASTYTQKNVTVHVLCSIHGFICQQVWLSKDWASSKWSPVHKVWEQLCDNHSKVRQKLTDKNPLLFYCKINSPRVLLFQTKGEKTNMTMLILFFSPSSFLPFLSITHNSITIRHTRTFYIPNECSSSVDVPFLV